MDIQEQHILEPFTPRIEDKSRPTAITVICIIGFIGLAISLPLVFSQAAKIIGNWYPPYLAGSCVVGLVCMIGLWKMKKWAVYTYTAFVAINQIVLFSMGVWNVMAFVIPAIVIAIGFSYIKKMD